MQLPVNKLWACNSAQRVWLSSQRGASGAAAAPPLESEGSESGTPTITSAIVGRSFRSRGNDGEGRSRKVRGFGLSFQGLLAHCG